MRVAPAALVLAGLLPACEPRPVWVNTAVSSEQNQRDLSYCNGAAELAKHYSMNQRGSNDVITTDAFERCMRGKGYRPEPRRRS
ncbi:MAG: hypothetical protein QNJ94_03560 [Alphaproteobacteria bacterium]|nr:hypothetical protein [Alphaproteobacteria bacterium]